MEWLLWFKARPKNFTFLPAGAEAYMRDILSAEVYLLDTGHFALETHAKEISELIHQFLK
ncbi:hypothetical protein AM231_09115 [Paenibacillus solani]|uniref:Alpha/beta hydrolase n=1 Tax=Paenibacillus solani TaxID=1705565 RepID=A0A0M1P476_9BACL|nr:hypothetical protein AM231_09115 [Paenibacillus solani]